MKADDAIIIACLIQNVTLRHCDVCCHYQRNANKSIKAFKIKLAVTMTSPEERQNQVDWPLIINTSKQINNGNIEKAIKSIRLFAIGFNCE